MTIDDGDDSSFRFLRSWDTWKKEDDHVCNFVIRCYIYFFLSSLYTSYTIQALIELPRFHDFIRDLNDEHSKINCFCVFLCETNARLNWSWQALLLSINSEDDTWWFMNARSIFEWLCQSGFESIIFIFVR